MEKPSSTVRHEQNLILAEPKTLFEEEMNLARNAALEVINTHTKEEALKIFLKGLEPMGSAVKPDFTQKIDEE